MQLYELGRDERYGAGGERSSQRERRACEIDKVLVRG